MELQQLRYFVAVAELRGFTKAAERCGVSQPSLSQQIQKLERELGEQLLDRFGRNIKLTEAGEAFYSRAVTVLDAVDEAKAAVRRNIDWQTTSISIGAIHTIAPYLLPEVVQRISLLFPQAQITVEERLTEQLFERLLAGELDVAIMALPIAEKRLHAEPLFTDELLAAMLATSPLASRPELTLADLSAEPFVLLDEMHCLGQQTLRICIDHDCAPVVSCRTAQLLTVQEMVALGLGVSLVPQLAARHDRDKRRLYRSLAGAQIAREIGMVWRPRYQPRKLVEAVLEEIRKIGAEHASRVNTPGDSLALAESVG